MDNGGPFEEYTDDKYHNGGPLVDGKCDRNGRMSIQDPKHSYVYVYNCYLN